MSAATPAGIESVHDLLRPPRQPLDAIFRPQSVALIGATEKEGSVGRTIMSNLIGHSFGGTVFPVNPKRPAVLGIKAYPSVKDAPDAVDLAVIVTPAPTVPGLVAECVDCGVKAAIVISAGFKEAGPEGRRLEQEVLAHARRGGMRIIGPNCLGVMSPVSGFNATFAQGMAPRGNVAFLSQSGALCTAILDWSFREHVGFSAFVSTGSMLDVGWGDLITYLGDDPETKSILLYLESIGDARAFLSAAREVALRKPIIAIHVGKSEEAARAAASHTGALTARSDVVEAAFRRSGVTMVNRIEDLFNMAEVLSKQPRPAGPRLTILTNAGGPGVLATDALVALGGELAELSPETRSKLDAVLPPHWSRNNPIDVLGDADEHRYQKALEIAAADPGSDGMLLILTPQGMTHPTVIAEGVVRIATKIGKPVLASWMGGLEIASGEAVLNRAGVPTFPFPDTAARVFCHMWKSSYNLKGIYETPALAEEIAATAAGGREQAAQLIRQVLDDGRTLLTEYESKALLAHYGIPTVPTQLAHSEDDAVREAGAFGYPVVLKLHSHTITHKTDVGGVKLNLSDEAAVRAAFRAIREAVVKKASAQDFLGVTVQPMVPLDGYEVIVGCSPDPVFGPVVLFGTGGTLVEVFEDRALGLPPLNTTLARRMMEQTKIFEALQGIRGRKAVNLPALERHMVAFSRMVVEHPRIKELDINPLLASEERLIALDARVVLYGKDTPEEKLPRPAIRPYPLQYAGDAKLKGGTVLRVRPILPEDEPALRNFHETLSERSVYLRYGDKVALGTRVAHERLARLCFIDYDRELALVALHGEGSVRQIAAVARLNRIHGTGDARFAMLVADAWQKRGLGSELLKRLIEAARAEGIARLGAAMLQENDAMRRMCERLGFASKREDGGKVVSVELKLR